MKYTPITIAAVFVSFVLGLAINHACADSRDMLPDSDLQSIVKQLQSDVNKLKNEIEYIKSSLPSDGTSSSYKIDGLYFDQAGFIESKINHVETQKTTKQINGEVSNEKYVTLYEYDSKGRVSKWSYSTSDVSSNTICVYEGKTVTTTTEHRFKSGPIYTTIAKTFYE